MNHPSPSARRRNDVPGAYHQALEQRILHLMVAVEHELRLAPDGMSELHLLKALQNPPWELFGSIQFSEPEKLYPVHFLLFHVLFRLRDQLADSDMSLSISALNISLSAQPMVSGDGLPDATDKLREFYLDLSHYQLGDSVIQQMMDDFLAGRTGRKPAEGDLKHASAVLNFEGIPTSFSEVKHRFRRAVMQAHPDRGGDTGEIQRLNEAFSVFKTHFNRGS
ncbi:DNA-J related domain-containing protein [Marinobacter sp. chi1]|uniref:DNA-J related domain-containing protein n=1 Tax=Marinobacter suaedae TaxID=3057675 RepID=A0ABT8W2X8_9GAMM|nr:DNA-J related domain-containing protein [Marinobacter sp. chi1]MDO3722531.1 DNA-J related domain-containing protein [Marinobacter sp. chi1]